ncbi:MAG: prepilin-type N-terminal cleavage/methylation domain-containing protein [Candidatus Gribaldobacteria bacterium]|nr:prepilin-type N-terminal cleavage/methylation domain-containing protein [Candidatus Gribaldobacteria bacterium]
MRNILKIKNSFGFTLLELLIAMVIFSIIIIAFVALFLSAIKEQRKILNLNNLINSTSYSLEYMDRAIRMARKDVSANSECVGATAGYKYNFGTSTPAVTLRFLTFDNKCWEFSKQGDQLVVKKSNDIKRSGLGAAETLTPIDLVVKTVSFEVLGDGQAEDKQPKVTLNLIMNTKDNPAQERIFQTTISQRNLNVEQ